MSRWSRRAALAARPDEQAPGFPVAPDDPRDAVAALGVEAEQLAREVRATEPVLPEAGVLPPRSPDPSGPVVGEAEARHQARRAEALRYATEVLGLLPDPTTDVVVARSLVRAGRRVPRRLDDAGRTAHLQQAVRTEAWRHQRRPGRAARAVRPATGPVARPRRLRIVLASLLLVAVAAGAAVLVARRHHDPGSQPPARITATGPGVVRGRVTALSGDRLVGRPGIGVRVLTAEGALAGEARTDAEGRFAIRRLPVAAYRLSVTVPTGYRGQRSGGSGRHIEVPVDLADRTDASVAVQLVRES